MSFVNDLRREVMRLRSAVGYWKERAEKAEAELAKIKKSGGK